MLSEAQLESDARHVDYEIWMFMETSSRLLLDLDAPYLPNDEVLRRALLESCLLHFRALVEFLGTTKKHPDDLRATDYIDDAVRRQRFADIAPTDSDRSRVNELHKALAHIVSGRDRLNTDWSDSDMSIVRKRLELFFSWLPTSRLDWFPLASKWFPQSEN